MGWAVSLGCVFFLDCHTVRGLGIGLDVVVRLLFRCVWVNSKRLGVVVYDIVSVILH